MADHVEEIVDENCSDVDLGFVEKCANDIYLTSLFFPSKLGGRPAWLRWDSLPSPLNCGNCEKPLILLCQIYVPLELPTDASDQTKLYHRTIYLFCCRNGPCSKYNSFIKAFRTERLQIDEDEHTIESESDIEKLKNLCKQLEQQHSLCELCGCLGEKTCSSCHQVKYCCKEHQTIDWKYRHKKECNAPNNSPRTGDGNGTAVNPLLFNEYEIVIEAEPSELAYKDATKNGLPYSDPIRPIDPQLEREIIKLDEQKVDEYFLNFRERIDREPEQIIRYELGGQPLWVSSENIPSDEDIPNCVCGAKRQYEFQVLPQMINYLGVETTIDSIDWGTLCVYTCSNNCKDGNSYKEEFVWKQDFSNSDVVS